MARRAGATRSDGRERDRGGRSPTRPDVLARIAALGIRDKELLARAGVAPAFLSKARSGACTDAKASASWSKVEATLLAVEREKGKASAAAAPAAAPATSRPEGPEAPALEAASAPEVPPEFQGMVAAIQGSTTAEALSGLQRRVAELAYLGPTKGGISPDVARVLIQCTTEQRQTLKAQAEAEEKSRGDEPLTIKIIYVDSWRERTAAGTKGASE